MSVAIKLAVPYSKEHFESMTIRETVLGSKIHLDKEADYVTFVAQEKGQIVGTLSVQLATLPFARIRQVAVLPEHQGKQIGNQLIQCAEQFLREKQIKWIVLSGRTSATGFYEKNDYHHTSFSFSKHLQKFYWFYKKLPVVATKEEQLAEAME